MKQPNPSTRIAGYLVALFIALLMVYPFVWMISSSLKPTKEIFESTLNLIPEQPTVKAYESLRVLAGIAMERYVFNSLYIVGVSTVLSVLVSSLGAYAVHRKPGLPGFGLLDKFFLVSIMYPYILLLMPVYVLMFRLGLLGTYTGIILFLTLGPIQYYLFREFFSKVPDSVIESAQMDGATEWQVFGRIVFPMARPVFLTGFLLTFILNWDKWFPVLVISTSMKTYTLTVALFNLDTQLQVDFPAIMALSTIVSAPIIAVFIATQRRVMEGFAVGSVKG
jgi:ABC-type glycerol-3-phosphate transport system permease component